MKRVESEYGEKTDVNPPKKKIWRIVWRVVTNVYFFATIIFLSFYLFLGENNIIVRNNLSREVSSLKKEERLLEEGIRQDSIEAASLYNNPEALEAYGREHYYMKRQDEDIFIIKKK